MKRVLSSVLRLILCGIETLGLGICIPVLGANSTGVVQTLQAADCLRDLTVQVSANPSNIVYGQSSLVSWSVHLPSECGYASVQLNGQPVAPSGNQRVIPSQSTRYRVTVFLNLNEGSIEKTASTRGTVKEAAMDRFCPNHCFPTWRSGSRICKKLIRGIDG